MTTFDSHPKSKFWSIRNTLKTNNVALNSHKKFWFDCECGHNFESSLLNVNQANNWCGFCSNPPKKLCDCSLCFDKSFASHPKSSCWSEENELNPRQVFKCADRKTFKFNCDKCPHKFEMKCANENGFSIIRILQKDVYKNKYNWLSELCVNIEKITNENIVQNIYMCKNNEYTIFTDLFRR